MSVMRRVTWRSLRENRARTAVTVFGVAISVAMICAVTTFIASFLDFMRRGESAEFGGWHVMFRDVGADFAEKIACDPETESSAVIQSLGYARLEGLVVSLNPSKPYIHVAGIGSSAGGILPLHMVEGREPRNSSEIVIPKSMPAAGSEGFRIGDTLVLTLGSRTADGRKLNQTDSFVYWDDGSVQEVFTPERRMSWLIVGICEKPGFENFGAPGYTAVTVADPDPEIFDLAVVLKSPRNVNPFTERYAGTAVHEEHTELLSYYGVSGNYRFVALINGLAAILVGVIMTGSVLMIHNAFAISVSERTRQFGVLASVGASAGQLHRSVIFEGLCVAAAGVPLGVVAGLGGIGITLGFIGSFFAGFTSFAFTGVSLRAVISAPSVAVAALTGTVCVLVSAHLPARRALKRSPLELIRQSGDVRISAKEMRIPRAFAALAGFEGTLALKNFRRDRKRHRSTVVSLAVSIMIFVTAGSFGMYFRESSAMTRPEYGYDLFFSASQGVWELPEEQLLALFGRLSTAKGVTRGSYWTIAFLKAQAPKAWFTDQYLEHREGGDAPGEFTDATFRIQFLDDALYARYFRSLGLNPDGFGLSAGRLAAVARHQGYDGVRTVAYDVFRSGEVTLKASAGPDEGWDMPQLEFTAVVMGRTPDDMTWEDFTGLTVFAPYSEMSLLGAPPESFGGLTMVFSSDEPGESATLMEAMMSEAGASSGYRLRNLSQTEESNRALLIIVDVFTYGFVSLITLIAVANVFNTISTGVSLRMRELAVLRSVGMGNRSFRRMMNAECLYYGFKSLVLGLPASCVTTWLIYRVFFNGVDVVFRLPLAGLAAGAAGTFAVVFVSMMYAAGRVRRMNVMDALRTEA